jgi:ELMO domain-containing protein
MLQEIWNKLVNEPFSRYGSHWNKIGFQGRDPATDLRSTGVLSLLQWLLYIEAHPK